MLGGKKGEICIKRSRPKAALIAQHSCVKLFQCLAYLKLKYLLFSFGTEHNIQVCQSFRKSVRQRDKMFAPKTGNVKDKVPELLHMQQQKYLQTVGLKKNTKTVKNILLDWILAITIWQFIHDSGYLSLNLTTRITKL